MELAKASLEKVFHNDSVINVLPKKMRAPFAKDIAKSMKEITEEIRKAKLEMENQWKEKKIVHFDKEKVEKEIKKAMEEVSRIDLGKLVASALDIPGLIFSEEKETSLPRKIRMDAPAFPKGADNLRKLKRSNPAETEIAFPDQQKTETDNIELDAPAVRVTDAPMPATHDQMHMDASKLIRIKQLLLREALRKQIKVMPVTYIVDGEKETKLVIVLQ